MENIDTKKKYEFDSEILKKKRMALIIVMICALAWMMGILFKIGSFMEDSIEMTDSVFSEIKEDIGDEYDPGEEMSALMGVGIVGLFGYTAVSIAIILYLMVIFLIACYLIFAIITWILAAKKKKAANIFAWICFLIYGLCVGIISLGGLLNVINIIGIIVLILHIVCIIQYRKVFKKNGEIISNEINS